MLVVVASDKGLCGAFNSHVLKQAEARYQELAAAGREVFLVTIGTKAGRYFSKRGMEPKKKYNGMISRLQYADAANLASELQALFLSGGAGSVEFAFNEFVSASKQQFVSRRLLPVVLDEGERAEVEKAPPAERVDYIFEPGADAIFQALLPRFITAMVYQFLLQSMAAEQMARMVAMDLATRNASDMIRQLTLLLNKMRQAAITKELSGDHHRHRSHERIGVNMSQKEEKHNHVGKVIEVIGPVVDIEFAKDELPAIYNAIEIVSDGFVSPQPIRIITEVQYHLGENRVRTISMHPTDGLVRGMQARDTGRPHHRARRPGSAGAADQRDRRPGRQPRPDP